MFRNQYDNDVNTWSPQGRLLQVEYATEAVKQGSIALGCRNKTHVVLVAIKRSPGDLASYQKKILPVDSHCGVAIAGLTSDARVLSAFMKSECLNQRLDYDRQISIYRLSNLVADKAQSNTLYYGGRPYGVGLLIAGYDETGPHLFECSPTGNYYEYYAMAIGARSQPARTYLEKSLDELLNADLKELVFHGLAALQDSLPQDNELTQFNTSISIVGKDTSFHILTNEEVEEHLVSLRSKRPLKASRKSGRGSADGAEELAISDQPSTGPQDETGGRVPSSQSGVTPPMGSMDVDDDVEETGHPYDPAQ